MPSSELPFRSATSNWCNGGSVLSPRSTKSTWGYPISSRWK